MEYQLLSEIQRLRRELSEAIESLHTEETGRGLREQLQDTRTEFVTVHEKLAAILTKQEQCGCKCCKEGAHMCADLQASDYPVSEMRPCRLICVKERFGSLQRNLDIDTSESTPRSSLEGAPPDDAPERFGTGRPHRG